MQTFYIVKPNFGGEFPYLVKETEENGGGVLAGFLFHIDASKFAREMNEKRNAYLKTI